MKQPSVVVFCVGLLSILSPSIGMTIKEFWFQKRQDLSAVTHSLVDVLTPVGQAATLPAPPVGIATQARCGRKVELYARSPPDTAAGGMGGNSGSTVDGGGYAIRWQLEQWFSVFEDKRRNRRTYGCAQRSRTGDRSIVAGPDSFCTYMEVDGECVIHQTLASTKTLGFAGLVFCVGGNAAS
jgi:hypothetical protein